MNNYGDRVLQEGLNPGNNIPVGMSYGDALLHGMLYENENKAQTIIETRKRVMKILDNSGDEITMNGKTVNTESLRKRCENFFNKEATNELKKIYEGIKKELFILNNYISNQEKHSENIRKKIEKISFNIFGLLYYRKELKVLYSCLAADKRKVKELEDEMDKIEKILI